MLLPHAVPFQREQRELPSVRARASQARSEGLAHPTSVPSMTNLPNMPMPRPANTRIPTVLGRGAAAYGRTREVAALVLWTLALFFAPALASYQGAPSGATGAATSAGPDWVGPVGALGARALVSLVGLVAWALPLELMLMGIPLVRGKESPATAGRIAGDLLLAVVTAALVQVGSPGRTAFGTHPAGGIVGELFGELGRSLFSTAGSFLVGFACLGLILIGRAAFSFIAFARLVARLASRAAEWTAGASKAVREAWRQARALERERTAIARIQSEPNIDTSPRDEAIVAALPFDLEEGVVDALIAPDFERPLAVAGDVASEPPAKRRSRKPAAQAAARGIPSTVAPEPDTRIDDPATTAAIVEEVVAPAAEASPALALPTPSGGVVGGVEAPPVTAASAAAAEE